MQDVRVNVRYKDEHGNTLAVRKISTDVESDYDLIIKTGLQIAAVGGTLLLLKYVAITLILI